MEEDYKKEKMSDKLVLIAQENMKFFNTSENELFALIKYNDFNKIVPLNTEFNYILAKKYREKYKSNITSATLQEALLTLKGYALDSKTFELENRIIMQDNKIFYDLSNQKWEYIEIDKEGWKIKKTKKPRFRRYKHQESQIYPAKDSQNFNDFINLFEFKNEHSKLLLKVYIISCFIPDIPKVVWVLYGTTGSTKTTLMRLMRMFIDPSKIPVMSLRPNGIEQQLNQHYCTFFDNISYLSHETQDVLCRASTGEGIQQRKLYSDDDAIIFKYIRCVGLTGINIVPTHPDLLDRCMVIELKSKKETERKKMKEVQELFNEMHPKIFHYILDTLVKAIKIKETIKLKELPRMADFAEWGEAISRAMGYEHNKFMIAYKNQIKNNSLMIVENNQLARTIQELMKNREEEWKGKADDLYKQLKPIAKDLEIDIENRRHWPCTSAVMGKQLRDIIKNLEVVGITCDIKSGDTNLIILKTDKTKKPKTNKKVKGVNFWQE